MPFCIGWVKQYRLYLKHCGEFGFWIDAYLIEAVQKNDR